MKDRVKKLGALKKVLDYLLDRPRYRVVNGLRTIRMEDRRIPKGLTAEEIEAWVRKEIEARRGVIVGEQIIFGPWDQRRGHKLLPRKEWPVIRSLALCHWCGYLHANVLSPEFRCRSCDRDQPRQYRKRNIVWPEQASR